MYQMDHKCGLCPFEGLCLFDFVSLILSLCLFDVVSDSVSLKGLGNSASLWCKETTVSCDGGGGLTAPISYGGGGGV